MDAKRVRKRVQHRPIVMVFMVLLEMMMSILVFSRRMVLAFGLALSLLPTAHSQSAASLVQLQGRTDAREAFDVKALRGKVVVVYAWATDCPVCISHMPELRANRQGWAGQPFEMVSISTDTREADIAQWHTLQQQTLRAAQRWPSLWTGGTEFATNLPLAGQLPAVWVLDKTGQIKYHVRGRVAPEVWNQVADLL